MVKTEAGRVGTAHHKKAQSVCWLAGDSRDLRLESPTRTGIRYTRWGWAVPILPMDDIQRVLSRCLAFEGLIHASWRNKAHACLEKPALSVSNA
jgi:hypothetical protein